MTFYTCDALENKLKNLLYAIGARKDARVEARCFDPAHHAQHHADALLAFAIPVFADVGMESELADDIFPARLQEIMINRRKYRHLAPGDCELFADFRRQVVDKLDIVIVAKDSHCRSGFFAPSMKIRILQPHVSEAGHQPEANID